MGNEMIHDPPEILDRGVRSDASWGGGGGGVGVGALEGTFGGAMIREMEGVD